MEYQINIIGSAGHSWVRIKNVRYINADEPRFPDCLVLWGKGEEHPVGIFPFASVSSCCQAEEGNHATDKD